MILKRMTAVLVVSTCMFFTTGAAIPDKDQNATAQQTTQEDDNAAESSEESEAVYTVKGQDIIASAMKYLGKPYRRSARGPHAFDCSGFTSLVYRTKNISLLRSSRQQFTQGTAVDRDELKPGDLVFFSSSRSRKRVGHVGIVTEATKGGNFKFVHAARSGIKVDNLSSSPYYKKRYMGARRILEN